MTTCVSELSTATPIIHTTGENNFFVFTLIPGDSVAIARCKFELTLTTDLCDITEHLDRGDRISIGGQTFTVSGSEQDFFGAHCIKYGADTERTCEKASATTNLNTIATRWPHLCQYLAGTNCNTTNATVSWWPSLSEKRPLMLVPLDRVAESASIMNVNKSYTGNSSKPVSVTADGTGM